jgi:ABC-type transport system involved in cytochrome bd biosynthesis fused ATPase/permease subunit
MKRIAGLMLLVVLAAGWWTPVSAQDADVSKSGGQSEKSAQNQQKALYQYQKKQEKAQQKAQRRSDKQERKAAKRYEKQQQKLLKNANLPAKHTS